MSRWMTLQQPRRSGFTLLEMIVVIGVVGVMFSMLLSALQSAREGARRTSCKNHLAQLAKGMIQHESQHRFFPTGGWSKDWLGTGDRSSDSAQPGGWTFTVLPFIEEMALRDSVEDVPGGKSAAEAVYEAFCETPVSGFVCPSRRTAAAIQVNGTFLVASTSEAVPEVAIDIKNATRCDYAANGGDVGACLDGASDGLIERYKSELKTAFSGSRVTFQCWNSGACATQNTSFSGFLNGHHKTHRGRKTGQADRLGACPDDLETLGCTAVMDAVTYSPKSLQDGDRLRQKTISQRIVDQVTNDQGIPDLQTGLIARMSQIRAAAALDGLSNVYLLGEKYVAADQYEEGADVGDRSILYAGYSMSNVRWATVPPAQDEAEKERPSAFGSAHAEVWNAAFGDGSVRSMSYDIDPEVHKNLAARAPRFEGEVLGAEDNEADEL